MARRESRSSLPDEAKLDFTPIIDIVFNLIVFFMIASELNNRNVEQITIPFASEAAKQKPAKDSMGRAEKVLQVNVMPTGVVKVRSIAYSVDPQTMKQYPALASFMEIEAAGYEREDPEPGQGGTPPSKLRVNIRADREVRFRYVQGVFDACVKHGVYKTSLAADPDVPKF
jgi:biopolymer transport protein ExbD